MRCFLAAGSWLLLLSVAAADSAAPRVAIVSDAANRDLAALVTTELSSGAAVTLLERDTLAKIGDEARLQQMAGSDATALGKLVGADGILFLDQRADGPHVRLTASNLGYALFDDPVPSGLNPQQEAKAIAHLIDNDAAKLRLDQARAVPISVLNLRADQVTGDSPKLERNLTLLLESRLAAVPEYVVLERRHAWSLGFEHELTASNPPLLQGAYLVDGSFRPPPAAGGTLTLQFRVRSPKNQESTATVEGPSGDLHILVEKLLAQIQKNVGSSANTSAWQPQAEAREYLREGIWAWHAGQPRVALEALDSAELLGESAPDLLATRIDVLCQLGGDVASLYSTGTGTNWMDRHFLEPNTTLPADPRPEERTEFMSRAMADCRTYTTLKVDSRLGLIANIPGSNGTRPILYGLADELQNKVLYASSKVLAMLDALHDPREEAFRQQLRTFAGYDPLHQHMPIGRVFALDYADEWSESADEELAYLHNLCTSAIADYDLRYKLDHILTVSGPANFCPRFAKTPADQKALFQKFVDGLVNDPATKAVGLAARTKWDDSSQKGGDFHSQLAELWSQRDALFQSGRLQGPLDQAIAQQYKLGAPTDPQLVALFHYVLQHHSPGVIGAFTWYPDLFPAADAPSLWNDMEALKARAMIAANIPGNPGEASIFQAAVQGEYGKLEAAYIKQWGAPPSGTSAAPVVDSGTLTVNRYWCSWQSAGAPHFAAEQIFLTPGTNDTLWVYGYDTPASDIERYEVDAVRAAGLFQVHLPDLKTQVSMNPRSIQPLRSRNPVIAAGADAVYLATVSNNQPVKCIMDRFQVRTGKWESREMPQMITDLFPLADKIYYEFEGASGLARYDWDSSQAILLASSRRRPAQNQFDDRQPYPVLGVFAGPDGKPCAQIEGANYFIQETPGNWTLQSKLDTFGGIPKDPKAGFFPDSNGLHMSTCEPEFQPMTKEFFWYMACREKVDTQRKGDPVGYGYHNNDIFMVGRTDAYTIWWFQAGKPDPVAIPLKLTIDDATMAEMKHRYGDAEASAYTAPLASAVATMWMTITADGICLKPDTGGSFWFVPFSDIDAYLAAHGAGATSTTK